MSVTFLVHTGNTPAWDDGVNMANANARAVINHIGLSDDGYLCGEVRGRDLRKACETALQAPLDAEIPPVRQGNVIDCGRREGYLRERTLDLLKLAETAGDLGMIYWG